MATPRRHGKEKQKHQQTEDEAITPARTRKVFEDILQFLSSAGTPQRYKQSLVKLQQQFMQDLHPSPTKAATEFNSLQQALFAFGLKGERQGWRIENIPGADWQASTECLGKHSCIVSIQYLMVLLV